MIKTAAYKNQKKFKNKNLLKYLLTFNDVKIGLYKSALFLSLLLKRIIRWCKIWYCLMLFWPRKIIRWCKIWYCFNAILTQEDNSLV